MDTKTNSRIANRALTSKEISKTIRRNMTFENIKETLPKSIKEKMESVNINFEQDNILPPLNEMDTKNFGGKSLPVRLKRGIIKRQEYRHLDVKDDDVKMLLSTALYNPDIVAEGKISGYVHFVKKLGNDDNSLVLIDMKATEGKYYDIVHYFFVKDARRDSIVKK